MSAGPHTTPPAGRRARRLLVPAAATYVMAWVVGLVSAPARPGSDEAAELGAFLRDHLAPVLLQSFLVHGVAGVALAVVAVTTGQALASRTSTTAGLVAAVLSLVQVALLVAATVYAVYLADDVAARLVGGVDAVDAVKLLALAAFAVTSSTAGRRRHVLPTWASVHGVVLAGMLVLGSVSFVPGLGAPLGAALFVTLPLLLVFVAALAFLVARRPAARDVEVSQ